MAKMSAAQARLEAKRLYVENVTLRHVISEIWWMARRYADGRQTYAAQAFNNAVDQLLNLGIHLHPDPLTNTIYATDGDFDKPEDPHFIAGHPVAMGQYRWPWGVWLHEKIVELLGTSDPAQAAERIAQLLEKEKEREQQLLKEGA